MMGLKVLINVFKIHEDMELEGSFLTLKAEV